jgi:hypothetical protein
MYNTATSRIAMTIGNFFATIHDGASRFVIGEETSPHPRTWLFLLLHAALCAVVSWLAIFGDSAWEFRRHPIGYAPFAVVAALMISSAIVNRFKGSRIVNRLLTVAPIALIVIRTGYQTDPDGTWYLFNRFHS